MNLFIFTYFLSCLKRIEDEPFAKSIRNKF